MASFARPRLRPAPPLHLAVVGALLLAIAAIPVLPSMPRMSHQVIPGFRLIMSTAALALFLVLIGVIRRQARPWWFAVGLLSVVLADPTPAGDEILQDGAALLALVVLVAIAVSGQMRGAYHAIGGIGWALAATLGTSLVLSLGSDPDISLTGGVVIDVVVALVLSILGRMRAQQADGTVAELNMARRVFAVSHMQAASDDQGRVLKLPSGATVAFSDSLLVSVAKGDPLGPRYAQDRAIQEFVDFCRERGRVPCVFQATPQLANAYRDAGMSLIKFGEEAIVDIDSFDIRSPRRANVRHELARARRAGLRSIVLPADELDSDILCQMYELSEEWRKGRARELGFSLRRFRDLPGSDQYVSVVVDENDAVQAFTSWCRMSDGLALDLIRRRLDSAAGAVDLSIMEMLEVARGGGMSRLTLGSVPTRDRTDDFRVRGTGRWLRDRLHHRCIGGYRYRGLASFKDKFATSWETRLIAYPGYLSSNAAATLALGLVHWRRRYDAPDTPKVINKAA
jgi:lysylphosphatidylglycerol synthetase-like protein (DUF2156 family)